jgi:hypothetical protein
MTTPQSRSVIDLDSLAVNGREALTVAHETVAGTTALIVDNVYRDPDYVRGLALSLSYHRRAGSYPGYFAYLSVSASPVLDLINTLMSDIIGAYLTFTFPYKDDLVFAIVTDRAADLSPGQRRPHVDDFCDFAALIYLNPPEQCSGGTSFWRHRPTGMELAPDGADPASIPTREAPSDQPAAGDATGYPSDSTEVWELTHVLPARYNRLVVYNSQLIHSPFYKEDDFGTTLPARRLTQNFYLDRFRFPGAARSASRQRLARTAVDTSGPAG